MEEHIIRAILYQDMSVKWKDAEQSDGVNVHLNVHQKARQIVEAELGDFLLSEGEALFAAFEKLGDEQYTRIDPARMDEKADGSGFHLQIPPLVHNTPGAWAVYFSIRTNYDPIGGGYENCFPFNKAVFCEGSSFLDDGLEVPTGENLSALYKEAEALLERSNIPHLEEKIDAKVDSMAGSYSGYFVYSNYTQSDGTFSNSVINARAVTGDTNPKLSTVIPLYNGDGRLSGAYPIYNFNYATKAYVDNSIKNYAAPKQPTVITATYNATRNEWDISNEVMPSSGLYIALAFRSFVMGNEAFEHVTDFKYAIGVNGDATLKTFYPRGVTFTGFTLPIQTNIGADESPIYARVQARAYLSDGYNSTDYSSWTSIKIYNAETNEDITSQVAAPIAIIK